MKKNLEQIVKDWNKKNPVGTKVNYLSNSNLSNLKKVETKTRSQAWVMGGHSAMVMVESIAGGVSLDFVELIN